MAGNLARRSARAALFVLITAGFMAGLMAGFVGWAPAADAQAAEGLSVSSATTYTPNPAEEYIDVVSIYSMTNVQADEIVGNSVRSYYFTNWVVAIPANTINFAATSNGTRLATSIDANPDTTEVAFGSVTLPFNLNFQQSVTIEVSYTIPSGDPRSEGATARVNDSFLSFSVWATGDPGQTSVRIAIPEGFTMDFQGDLDELARVDTDEGSFYETESIQEPQKFFGRVFGRNDTGLIVDTATLPDATATVRAWPDDPDWADFVVDAIEDDVPIIEELIGLPWPAGDIEVIETVTPYLYGYGGWFNADSGIIEVGENLERDLILHELSHAWFNNDLIDGRWITEGLAEEFASQVIAATGGDKPDPDQPDLNNPLRVQLESWASPWTLSQEDAFAYEQYHYNASWWVMREITDEVGLDAFSDVLIALDDEHMAFPGEGPIEDTPLTTRWWHFFDLLERQAGAENLDELFGTYVLTDAEADRLPLRRETHARYDEFVEATGTWGAPLVVRNELSMWNFDFAHERMDTAWQVITLRDQTDALAAELDVSIEHQAEMAYEDATSNEDLVVARSSIESQLEALGELRDRRITLTNRAESLDLVVEYPAAPFDEARGFVVDLEQAIDSLKQLRQQTDKRAQEVGVTNPGWPNSDNTTDLVAAAALANARLATLDGIDTASASVAKPRSFQQRIGLIGSDLEGSLAQARTAFEADELDDALIAVGDVESRLATAAVVGRSRLSWAAVVSVLVSMTGAAMFFVRRRQLAGKEAT